MVVRPVIGSTTLLTIVISTKGILIIPLLSSHTVPTVKHGSESVACWRCYLSSGVGSSAFIDGNMTGYAYRDILDYNV